MSYSVQRKSEIDVGRKTKGRSKRENDLCAGGALTPSLISLSSLTFRQLTYLISDIEHLRKMEKERCL